MPWGGLLASAFYIFLGAGITLVLTQLVGVVFSSMNEALSFGYMGVNWSIGLCLVFGLGSTRPYLWAGQETAGSWEGIS
jgi:urea transporter